MLTERRQYRSEQEPGAGDDGWFDDDPIQTSRELDRDLLDDIRKFSQILFAAFTVHMFPMMSLGAKHADLDHKIHSFLNQLHHEHATWEMVDIFLAHVVAICTDWGVESGMADAPNVDYNLLFPYYCEAPIEADNIEAYDGDYTPRPIHT